MLSIHVENLPLAVVEWDNRFRVTRWSPRAESIFGWSESEVLGLALDDWRFVHEDDVSLVAATMHRMLQGEEARNVSSNRNYTRDGEVLQCEWYNSVLKDEQGNLASIFSLVQDKTSQERIESDRRQLASRLDSVMENMGEAFYLIDADGRFLYLNPQAERVLRRKRADLLGRRIWEAFPEAKLTAIHPAIQRVLASGKAESLEIFYEPLQQWLDITMTPSAEGLAVYFRVVSQRKLAELALGQSEERFRLLSKATNDAIWDWDLTTQALWWNDGFEVLFGFRRDEIEPSIRSWTSRIHPDDRERVVDDVHRAIEEGRQQWSGQYRYQRKDGSYATVRDRGHVIRDASGKALRMVGGMTDLTDRLALEEQLHQSQRMESIGQLTGGIAHDFNNLLTVIQGNAELLREELVDQPRLAELAKMVDIASQRGAELTHRLLAFARRQALEPRVVELNELLAGMDSMLRRTLGEHIEIELERAQHLWLANVDPSQLESALLNLCINARDAMPQGGLLTIETANVTLDDVYASQNWEVLPGQYVMLAVTDCGSGISPVDLQHVFEPFFTTKEQGKGTGLGLAMVFGFVKQSCGHVSIYSEPGEGTTVKLYLPRYDGDPAFEGTTQADPLTVTKPVAANILLVEDDALVRRYAEAQLLAMGYSVLVAENGPQALDIVRQRDDIDLLFTDVVMPGGMGGRQLADAARALRPGLRVLYTSGYTENAIMQDGRLSPGVLLLGKPYRRAELARKIGEAILHG